MVKELRRKQEIKRWLYSYPSLVLMFIITFFLVKGAFGLMSIERENAHRVSALEQESETLVAHEEDLKSEIANLQTEDGVVEAIKEKFSATRSGEHVAVIIDEHAKATSTDKKSKIWYRKLLDAILHKS